jgi:uncharacterized protein (TIGR00369 family)
MGRITGQIGRARMKPVLNAAELTKFMAKEFPQTAHFFEIERIEANFARVRMKIGYEHLRPGGTVSGPTMFLLADCAFYLATLAMIGPVALTVTTSSTINFMRKPAPGDLTAEARILKLGKVLSVGDVTILSDGVDGPVAHAAMTYAIPPKRG